MDQRALAHAILPEPLKERARLLAARILERRQRRSAAVRGAALVFHAVAPTAGDPTVEVDPAVSTGRLDGIAAYLRARYSVVRAAELVTTARERQVGERLPVAITFDDDLQSHRDYAAPVLARHDTVATAFLCEPDGPFWWQLLQVAIDDGAVTPAALPSLPEQLVAEALARVPRAIRRLAKAIEDMPATARENVIRVLESATPSATSVLGPDGGSALAAAGWEIGFHTRGHDLLTALGPEELALAVERRPSRATGSLPQTLAYPHGKAGPREAEAARRAGYGAAFTGYATILTEDTDEHLIGRLQPDTGTIGRFALGLARALDAGTA
jgi:peptidoglycan/xylan/chitin deacetylase (PgdA/CDA1 family)